MIEKGIFSRLYRDSKRHLFLKDESGREFFCKSKLCPKEKTDTSFWLINEIICYYFARRFGLFVPELKLFTHEDKFYLGTEYVRNRKSLNKIKLFDNKEDIFKTILSNNKQNLIFCSIFDLMYFNSDRGIWNILFDENNYYWFIDFDKAVFGDGKVDIGRLYVNLDDKFTDFLGDFAACKDLNNAVLLKEYQLVFQSTVDQMRAEFDCHISDCINEIFKLSTYLPVNDQLLSRMESTLRNWHSKLFNFFSDSNSIQTYREILQSRNLL